MHIHDPRQVVFTYLLHSSRQADNVALPDTIYILREHRIAQRIFFIVTYTTQYQQQIYASIIVRQTEVGMWDFAGFFLMGGASVADSSEQLSPQIAYIVSARQNYSFIGVVVLPNKMQITSLAFRDTHGIVFEDQLENGTVLFVTNQLLQHPIDVELYDHAHLLINQQHIFH
ncbi:hypothetical protein [Dictyobacter arantiisoli]|uniref:Uncharacterized protein n=1 Tax=Dictyobacter arantiisoli TaxID=2014874 RepID=A0A5A5TBE3_9CHLR|nr:hypothetical protein [Dictyobacter arantiisoli]GCF08476.1 hypothetical protein KDI_20400 [Dictyobacter arantiisoli]